MKVKVFDKMTIEYAKKLLAYLKNGNMSFTWTEQGRFITREDCRKVLGIELNKKRLWIGIT